MNPLLLVLLAILTPFLMVTTLFVPAYASIYGACYLIYDVGTNADPLAGKYLDIFYMVDVYVKLFNYWLSHIRTVSIWHYSLPIVVLPLVGFSFGFWITRKLARKLKEVLHLSVSH